MQVATTTIRTTNCLRPQVSLQVKLGYLQDQRCQIFWVAYGFRQGLSLDCVKVLLYFFWKSDFFRFYFSDICCSIERRKQHQTSPYLHAWMPPKRVTKEWRRKKKRGKSFFAYKKDLFSWCHWCSFLRRSVGKYPGQGCFSEMTKRSPNCWALLMSSRCFCPNLFSLFCPLMHPTFSWTLARKSEHSSNNLA